eukprot:190114-Amphidinium_carterae.2
MQVVVLRLTRPLQATSPKWTPAFAHLGDIKQREQNHQFLHYSSELGGAGTTRTLYVEATIA